jgi:hypothetical protein
MTHTMALPVSEHGSTAVGVVLRIEGPPAVFEGQRIGTYTYISVPENEMWLWRDRALVEVVLGGLMRAMQGQVTEIPPSIFVGLD